MVNSAYHMLAWRWTKLLEAIHSNIGGQLILKDAFQFSKEMNISDKFVVSFDVCSLSASIPLEETNNIIYEQCEWIPLPQNELRKLFHFQSCNQTDGVAMRSPLRSILADIFMAKTQNQDTTYYRRYVDDTFIICDNINHTSPLVTSINLIPT